VSTRPSRRRLPPGETGARAVYITICSCNYLGHALTLRSSFLEQHPGADFRIVLADEPDGDVKAMLEGVAYIEGRDIGIPTYFDMAFRYNIVEFNTAIKPASILHMFRTTGCDRVYYIDPDIYALQPWTHIAELMDRGASAVVTPHITAPLEDKLDPDDFRIMRTGIYNLGFIAFRNTPQSIAFIEWWGRKMLKDCRTDLAEGIFQDQKYIDLITCFVDDVGVLRHPGYNIAYWNLPHREVERRDGVWTANGDPIHFFHFSGVTPDNKKVFSKHQNRYPSTDVLGVLRDLVFEYTGKVEANAHARFKKVPYRYGFLTDGTPVTQDMRSIHAREVAPSEAPHAEVFAPAFELYNRGSPRVPAFEGIPFTRMMDQVWLSRRDLQAAFDVGTRDGQRGFLNWYVDTAAKEHRVGEACIAPIRRAKARLEGRLADAVVRPADGRTGATVFGFLAAESGVGEGGRRTLAALRAVGVPSAGRLMRAPIFKETQTIEGGFLSGPSPHPIHLFQINADNTAHLPSLVGIDDLEGRYKIGIWAWELSRFPDAWQPAFEQVDEVWTVSEFVAHSVRQATTKPVVVMHHPVSVGIARPDHGRGYFGLPGDKVVVLVAFDFNSYAERKNPWAALEVFKRVSARLPGKAHLVIKVHGRDEGDASRRALREAVEGSPDVTLVDRVLSRDEMDGLQAACDVYMSLHRSEGFGLNIAECMGHGKVVIATDYSGNVDFLDTSCGAPVGFGMVPVGADAYPFGEGQWWAEPDLDEAAAWLGKAIEDDAWRSAIGRAASLRVADQLSYRRLGERMKARLEAIARNF
jgi:glycosyltransferase involved in cell wall biosynthesis